MIKHFVNDIIMSIEASNGSACKEAEYVDIMVLSSQLWRFIKTYNNLLQMNQGNWVK